MADVFRVPMDVTYAIAGGEPALMAYRRWRNLSRDDLAAEAASLKKTSKRSRTAKRISRKTCLSVFPPFSSSQKIS